MLLLCPWDLGPAPLAGRGLALRAPPARAAALPPARAHGPQEPRPRRAEAGAAARPPSLCAPFRAAPGDAVRAARQRGRLGAVRAGGGRGQHGGKVSRLRPSGRRQGLQLQEGECGRFAGRAPGPEPGRAARAGGVSTCLRSRAGAERCRCALSSSNLRAPKRLRGLPVGAQRARRSQALTRLGWSRCAGTLWARADRSGSPARRVQGNPELPMPAGPP